MSWIVLSFTGILCMVMSLALISVAQGKSKKEKTVKGKIIEVQQEEENDRQCSVKILIKEGKERGQTYEAVVRETDENDLKNKEVNCLIQKDIGTEEDHVKRCIIVKKEEGKPWSKYLFSAGLLLALGCIITLIGIYMIGR